MVYKYFSQKVGRAGRLIQPWLSSHFRSLSPAFNHDKLVGFLTLVTLEVWFCRLLPSPFNQINRKEVLSCLKTSPSLLVLTSPRISSTPVLSKILLLSSSNLLSICPNKGFPPLFYHNVCYLLCINLLPILRIGCAFKLIISTIISTIMPFQLRRGILICS